MNTYEGQSKFSLTGGGCMVRKKRKKEILKGKHGRGPPDSKRLQISKSIKKRQGNMLVKENYMPYQCFICPSSGILFVSENPALSYEEGISNSFP
jgi:hypothetical protein